MGVNDNSLNEHVDRIKYMSNYTINEASYKLVDNIEEDDTVPEEIWSGPQPVTANDSSIIEQDDQDIADDNDATQQEDDPIPNDGGEDVDSLDPASDAVDPDPTSPVVSDDEIQQDLGAEIPDDAPADDQQSADEIQNEIIKSSVSAMQKMHTELEKLEMMNASLNDKIEQLNSDVEEVREPTNVEKLNARKDDSHPYYYNLNDMWDGNSFQARRQVQQEDSYGMKKLEDGSYVADFDTLPKFTDEEIRDSFR